VISPIEIEGLRSASLRTCIMRLMSKGHFRDRNVPAVSENELTENTLFAFSYFMSYFDRLIPTMKRKIAFGRGNIVHIAMPCSSKPSNAEIILNQKLKWLNKKNKDCVIFLTNLLGVLPDHIEGEEGGMVIWHNAAIDTNRDGDLIGYRRIGMIDKPNKWIILTIDTLHYNKKLIENLGDSSKNGGGYAKLKSCKFFPSISIDNKQTTCYCDSIPQGIFALHATVHYFQKVITDEEAVIQFNSQMAYITNFIDVKEFIKTCSDNDVLNFMMPTFYYAKCISSIVSLKQLYITNCIVGNLKNTEIDKKDNMKNTSSKSNDGPLVLTKQKE